MAYWPRWRGPLGTGEAPEGNPPITWSEKRNIRWKSAIPGGGSGSPIVWGDRIYLLSAVKTDRPVNKEADSGAEQQAPPSEEGSGRRRRGGESPTHVHQFTVIAVDRANGSIVWREVAREEVPHEGTHPTGSFAAASPVTDGEVLIASFGSRGIHAYDLEGKQLWEVDLGDMRTRNAFGEGSSPALHQDSVIVNWDHEGEDFIVALDKKTGKERWLSSREEATTWATPLVVEHMGKTQVIVNGTTVRAYDFGTGKELWSVGGMTSNPIPTPIFAEGLLFVATGFRGHALKVISLEKATGDLGDTEAVIWTLDCDTPYVPSPLLHQGVLYLLKSNDGMLSAFDAATGERLYGPERLPAVSSVYASPVAVKGRIYLAGRDGATVVIKHGSKPEVLATNELEDGFDASPAIAGDELYLRGREHLYCIAEE